VRLELAALFSRLLVNVWLMTAPPRAAMAPMPPDTKVAQKGTSDTVRTIPDTHRPIVADGGGCGIRTQPARDVLTDDDASEPVLQTYTVT
jgi:hypothetical protein